MACSTIPIGHTDERCLGADASACMGAANVVFQVADQLNLHFLLKISSSHAQWSGLSCGAAQIFFLLFFLLSRESLYIMLVDQLSHAERCLAVTLKPNFNPFCQVIARLQQQKKKGSITI